MREQIPGAKWWKFDFHNHTPASFDYGKGDESQKLITPKDWLIMYMKAGIDCVAVTDHNSANWIDKLKEANKELDTNKPEDYKKLYIFPGIELTVSTGLHLLAIFDPEKTTSEISTLLGSCEYKGTIGNSDGVTAKSLEQVIEIIVKSGGIAIPAHVDKDAGLFLEQEGNTLKQTFQTNKENLLALELINKDYEFPEIYKELKLNYAKVVGSDSHIATQVGTNYIWVKMSEPSLDALKLALHDGEDGIIRKDETIVDPNNISNRYFIKSISVSKGYKAGNGNSLKAEFSPWLSSVIGGRGSGKSTIINYLRIVLNRIDDMPKDIQDEFDKFYKIGSKTAPGMLREDTTIDVEIIKDGILHLIKWNKNTHTLQTWNETTKNWNDPDTVSNIKELFPVQIFNQKQLYALTSDPSKLIELIDSQFDKMAWKEEKDKLVEKWLEIRSKRRQLKNAISEESNIKTQFDATNNKIAIYESSSYKDTLNDFNKYNSVNKFFADSSENISNFIINLKDLEDIAPIVQIPEDLNSIIVDESLKFIIEINTALIKAKEKLSEAIQLVTPYKENLSSQFKALPWFEQFEEANRAYAGIVESIKEFGSESYETLIQRRNLLNDKLILITSQKEQLIALTEESKIIYFSIIEKEKELRIKRNEIIDRWKKFDNTTNPFLIIELHPMADADQGNTTFRELIRRPGGEFSNDIFVYNEEEGTNWGLIADIINEPEETRWEKRLNCLESFITATEANKKSLDLRLAKHLDYLKQNTPEDIDRLIIWVPEDKLVLKFIKEGKEEDIQTGSAGERTAGMLGLLLALNNIPLIIDQPEDDLDTRLISNFVVPGFKKLKLNRQLLLVTHNPNITVNANSDNIVFMNFNKGQIIVDGNDALQNKKIREAVCEVMEGGKEALNKRYYRISKALS